MSTFNSLGSNYDFGFALNSLFQTGKNQDRKRLENLLDEKYQGKVIFTYKGREALRLALRASNLKGASVGICGFTCFAVYEAVVKEGYKTEYLDIENNDLNFSVKTLEKAFKNNSKIKVVIIQNTLGYPCGIEYISKFCRERDIILIEDLAHSVGTKYKNGKEAGTVGDFVMLSFSQDKVIDKVAGGALIVRNKKFFDKVSRDLFLHNMDSKQKEKDRIYPIATFSIRKTYGIGFGKLLHKILKSADILSKPMEYIDQDRLHDLPSETYRSIYQQFITLGKNLSHRKKIAKIYSGILDKKILSDEICSQIELSSNLRFPIFVKNRSELISFLKKHDIFVSDIWYDAPVAPKKYLQRTDYKIGDSPNADNVSETILNLPTHKNVSEKDAQMISEKINQWLR